MVKAQENIVRQINTPKETLWVLQSYVDKEEKYKRIMEKGKMTVYSGSSRQIIEGEKPHIYNQKLLMIEPAYPQIDIRPELEDVERVNGRYAYKVKAFFGETLICSFYDCLSGLKV